MSLHFLQLLMFSVVFFFLVVLETLSFGFAENFTLYSSVGINDTNTRNLIAIYQNCPDYDPFNEFEVARVGQYDYRIFYGKDLDNGDYQYFSYYGIQSGAGVRYYYGGGSGSNLYLDKQGYVTVGNVVNSLSSPEASEFKFQYIVISCILFITILIIFKTFRKRISLRSSGGWQY